MSEQKPSERAHDKTLADSFPASDPPANSGITGADPVDKASGDRDVQEKPTGTPTSDRHAAETAHQSENDVSTSSGR
jgi:hypothetical protein